MFPNHGKSFIPDQDKLKNEFIEELKKDPSVRDRLDPHMKNEDESSVGGPLANLVGGFQCIIRCSDSIRPFYYDFYCLFETRMSLLVLRLSLASNLRTEDVELKSEERLLTRVSLSNGLGLVRPSLKLSRRINESVVY